MSSSSSCILCSFLTSPPRLLRPPKAKARLQAPTSPSFKPYKHTLDVLIRTTRNEGFLTLYRGFGAIVVGGTPGTMLYLCGYDIFKDSLSGRLSEPGSSNGVSSPLIHLSAGMLAETLACVIYVPVDVIKERLQVQQQSTTSTKNSHHQHNYQGSWDACRTIFRQEGLTGIYRGYFATLASFGPFSALYFACYEQAKHLTRRYNYDSSWNNNYNYTASIDNDDISEDDAKPEELSFAQTIICSASAGAIASFLTSPLDMAKLRLQIQRGRSAAAEASSSNMTSSVNPQSNMRQILLHMYHGGGVKGLFRGAGARVIHFVPATTITMTCYEQCRTIFGNIL